MTWIQAAGQCCNHMGDERVGPLALALLNMSLNSWRSSEPVSVIAASTKALSECMIWAWRIRRGIETHCRELRWGASPFGATLGLTDSLCCTLGDCVIGAPTVKHKPTLLLLSSSGDVWHVLLSWMSTGCMHLGVLDGSILELRSKCRLFRHQTLRNRWMRQASSQHHTSSVKILLSLWCKTAFSTSSVALSYFDWIILCCEVKLALGQESLALGWISGELASGLVMGAWLWRVEWWTERAGWLPGRGQLKDADSGRPFPIGAYTDIWGSSLGLEASLPLHSCSIVKQSVMQRYGQAKYNCRSGF